MGSKIKFYEDPGHGWLAVPRSELELLGIADKISAYSYQSRNGQVAYLEEDGDLATYLRALNRDTPEAVRDFWEQHVETVYHEDGRVRNLPHYQAGAKLPVQLAWAL